MPNPAYAKFKIGGSDVPGEVTSTDGNRDGAVEILEVHHEVDRPTETSGLASGRRVHKPMRLIKKVDKVSPSLYQALVENRSVEVELFWYKADPETGKMVNFFKHVLKNALVTNMKLYMPYAKDPAKEAFTELEEVSLRYHQIDWIHVIDNVEATDAGSSEY